MLVSFACLTLMPPVCGAEETAKPDLATVVKGNTDFALELYAKLGKEEGNLFFSPYSISTALAMTYAGARGETAEEMAKTLHFDQEKLHPAMGTLITQVNDADNKKRGYQLSTANALWGQKGYPFAEDFLALNKKNYGAGVKEVDFAGQTEQARQMINKWVEEQTNDKIKELFKEGVLSPDTRLVLANAIYFKGNWASQFKKDQTNDRAFLTPGGKKIKTPMMFQTEKFGYAETPDVQVLDMPYVGKDLSMVVLLPRKVDGLAALEKNLSSRQLGEWFKNLREQKVIVGLPKFKMTSEFALKQTLSEMGMPKAFTFGADFSGMTGKENDLFIQAVVHKAFVEVNEEGTEAAAATGVGFGQA
jgi:serpin B